MRTIFWAGDSTSKTNKYVTYPQTGIAQAFDRYCAEDVVVYNHAENGRSTKSFMDEGRLARIYDESDSLFIQFGHNDEKSEDPTRYSDPWGDFITNLGKFINVARDKKAWPLLISPVERRHFDDRGVLIEPTSHGEYPAAVLEAGRRFDVPVVDLFTMSHDFIKEHGDEATRHYYLHFGPGAYDNYPEGRSDDSHLSYEGAQLFSGMIARGLLQLDTPYSSLVAPDAVFAESTRIELNG